MPIKFSDLPSVDFAKIDSLVGLSKDNNGWYNNIIPKHTIMNNIDEQIKNMFNLIFPVGSLYLAMCHFSICPLQEIGVGKWEITAKDKCLQGSSNTRTPGSLIDPGLPNVEHTHWISTDADGLDNKITVNSNGIHKHNRGSMNITGYFGCGSYTNLHGDNNVFKGSGTGSWGSEHAGNEKNNRIDFDASKNWSGYTSENGNHIHTLSGSTQLSHIDPDKKIYGNSHTVQPPAYVVDVWQRTE